MKSVLLAMSGGVDSAAAAILLQKQGYAPSGVTFLLFDRPDRDRQEWEDARDAAERLGIPFSLLSLQEEFRRDVIRPFIDAYLAAKTPNPCIFCNKHIKFQKLLEAADAMGIDHIATGHYARIQQDPSGRYLLKKATDPAKDQSYVLYQLTQAQLSRLCFPLAEITKEEARQLVAEAGIPIFSKPDSQEICFIPDDDYPGFIQREATQPIRMGNFLGTDGTNYGPHGGIIRYTIGQRKGLGVAAGKPLYVLEKSAETGTVVLGDNDALFRTELLATDLNFIPFDSLTEPLRCTAKTRYKGQEAAATVYPSREGIARVVFDQPQRAITPGQAVVFYSGETVLGGGTIL